MLAIGTLIGSSLNLDFGSNKASEQVVKEFNSRMDKLEKQSEDKSNDESSDESKSETKTDDKANDSTEAKSESTTDGSQTEQQ